MSTYISKQPDSNGIIHYTAGENAVWNTLITRQKKIVQDRACDAFLEGLSLLNLSHHRIPQCEEISCVLREATGWALEPVPALISFDRFFYLLAHKRFPAATFIRREDELTYLKEPDIFHEIFGHCPLLTNKTYANFIQRYGELGLKANEQERLFLGRLFWFTVEFGLMQTPQGLRAYGGGILSSINETVYALENTMVQRKPFALIETLQTDYRIDRMQTTYFVVNGFEDLFQLLDIDLLALIKKLETKND